MYTNNESKVVTIYKNTKERAQKHLELLKNAHTNEIIESDSILQYIQHTIDCLEICLESLSRGSETRIQYAKYKDELGDLGEEIIKLTKPNRW